MTKTDKENRLLVLNNKEFRRDVDSVHQEQYVISPDALKQLMFIQHLLGNEPHLSGDFMRDLSQDLQQIIQNAE